MQTDERTTLSFIMLAYHASYAQRKTTGRWELYYCLLSGARTNTKLDRSALIGKESKISILFQKEHILILP